MAHNFVGDYVYSSLYYLYSFVVSLVSFAFCIQVRKSLIIYIMKAKDIFKKYQEKIVHSFAIAGAVALIAIIYVSVNSNPMPMYGGVAGQKESAVTSDGFSRGMAYDMSAPSAPEYAPMPGKSATNFTEERKVVKNGSLSLLVERAEDAIEQIKGIADRLGGFVENSSLYDSDMKSYRAPGSEKTSKYGNIVIRVPSARFDEALGGIKALAVKVERDSSNARDVSAEYVDLQAQLKNLKTEEEQYVSIMKRAVKVEDILNVSSRLADVRGRIERMQAQFNFLSKQVDMSTISVDLHSEADIESVGASWRPLSVAKQALQDMLNALVGYADGLIIFIINIPILLLGLLMGVLNILIWIAGLYLAWKLAMYIKERFL